MTVKLSKEQKINIANTDDLYKIMQRILLRENMLRRAQEHFWVVGLNRMNKLLFVELISLGADNRVAVSPPVVFRMAIYKLATKVVLVHNHPSGSMSISETDKDFTDRLLKAGGYLDIVVSDHLIISEKKYVSLEKIGLMDEFRNNGMYELVRRDKADMMNLKMEIEKERSEKNKAIEIAKKMRAKGMNNELIKEMTGLNLRDIKKL